MQRLDPRYRQAPMLYAVHRDILRAASAGHQAVFAPHTSGFDGDGALCLVGDPAPRESLWDRLTRRPLTREEALFLLLQVCAALQSVATLGRYHGRMTPLSILILDDGRVLLTDFGVWRLGPPPQAVGRAYLAPEVSLGEPRASAAGDVFALGAILYACLSGRRMFDGDTSEVSPVGLGAGAERVGAVIARACARRPAERFADAGGVARALREALLGMPQTASDVFASGLTPEHPSWSSCGIEEPVARPAVPEVDAAFLARLDATIRARLADPEISVEDLALALALSPRQLQRDVNRLTGRSPGDYLRSLRMIEAQSLLHRGRYATVAEVAGAVGMSPRYFRRVYAAWFGRAPSADLNQRR